jgi:hypothetical protein
MEMSMKEDPVLKQFRVERAKRAAEARWGRARADAELRKVADAYRIVDPSLTPEQAYARAVGARPDLYEDYNRAAAQMPHMTFGEMEEVYQQEVRDLCALAEHPEMADHFIRNRTAQRDIVNYFLERRKSCK